MTPFTMVLVGLTEAGAPKKGCWPSIEGHYADEAGSLAIQKAANTLGHPIVVGNDSDYHAGKIYYPEGWDTPLVH